MGTRDLRREIDALKNRARVGRSASRRERLPFDVELLRRVESAETSAELIAQTLRTLADSLPELQPYRRLEKDGWVVGLSGAERATAGGFGVRLARSRIEVVITTDGTHGTLKLVCRRTVLDRELDVLSHEPPLTSKLSLGEWIEAACLSFAAALLSRRATQYCAQVA